MPKIIAHRGYIKKAPENTISSFQQAVEAGADAIELDLHQTADGELVIHHDYTLGHPDNGSGNIFEKSLVEIQQVDAGSWFSQKFQTERIPTLQQVFDLFGNTIKYEVELKESTLEFLEKVVNVVFQYKLLQQIEFTSPHLFLLGKLKQLYPQAKTGVFFKAYPEWMSPDQGERIILNTLIALPADVAHLPLSIINKELVAKLKTEGKAVHAADCNDFSSLKKVVELGCDQFSTNEIELARSLMDRN